MRELRDWFQSPLGRTLADAERAALALQLRNSMAQTLLQLGAFGDDRRIALFGSVRQYLADDWRDGPVDLATTAEDLPFQPDSFDVVVLVHQLEFSAEPHQVLREVERVLAPEGQLLVLGFNPFSLWGLRHLWSARRSAPPWSGRYFTQARVEDWCRLLGLQTSLRRRLFYWLPWGGRRLQALEPLFGRALPWFGAVHLTVARKHVMKPLQMRPAWRPQRVEMPNGLAQPTSRSRVNVGR